MVKHLVISRLWFDSVELMDKYLDVSVKVLVPALKSQTCKAFEFGILLKAEHIDYVRERLGIDFTSFTGGIEEFRGVAEKEGYTIQTRHDIDDWMAPGYIEEIQKIYFENKDKYDSFVIHAQPVKQEWPSQKIIEIAPYHDRRISMFSTLCQKSPIHPIYKGSHGQLYQYGQKVFEIPKGFVKWVQHENTVTNARMKGKNIKKVGNMRLYDTDHNWISERATAPVLNVLTRTFQRPNSFAACRESVESQTYPAVNHIVGSEVICDYHPAIKLTRKSGNWLPWNLHLNDLAKHVKTGWVMYLDDDDKFLHPGAAAEIMNEIENEDQLLLWRVKIGEQIVPNDTYFKKVIKAGQISGIGFAFHSKHLPVPWEARRMGDFHVIDTLSKKLKVKWVDKLLTGTQGKKNNHGKVPPAEIITSQVGIEKGLVSVGTPTWNNADIYWLSIESLCRQKTSFPWELIVFECPSPRPVGVDGINEYAVRLKAAGCQRIVYINKGYKVDLSTKWKEIAAKARGEVLILHDSDDYTHPLRIQRTMELIGDKPWYDTRYAWHYNIPDRKMMLYDYVATEKRWKTGFNIAVRTQIIRSMPDPKINKGIHSWMINYVNDKYVDETNYPCVATTGMNIVSLTRRRGFDKSKLPWLSTTMTIDGIGLPEDIVARLKGVKEMRALDIERSKEKVEVEFTRNYCRLYKEGERRRISKSAYYHLLTLGHVKLISEETNEPIMVEI